MPVFPAAKGEPLLPSDFGAAEQRLRNRDCVGSKFLVLGQLIPCVAQDTDTCLKSIAVLLNNDTNNALVIKEDGLVKHNGEITLPYITPDFTVFRPSSFHIMVQTTFGLQMQVQLVPRMQIYITLDKSFQTKTCGLCGNFNMVLSDDLKTPQGLVEGTAASFGNFWKAQANCPDRTDRHDDPCSYSIDSESYAEHWCSKLKEKEGQFAKCHSTVNPDKYYKRCKYSSCTCEKSEDCLCAVFSSYVRACTTKGIYLQGWRDAVCEKYTERCHASQTFSYMLQGCQRTCDSLGSEHQGCITEYTPVDGCACPDGLYEDEKGVCVPMEKCPCYHKGEHVKPGKSINIRNEHCVCTNGKLTCRTWKRRITDCPTPKVFFNCSEAVTEKHGIECAQTCKHRNIDCVMAECESGCQCPIGLLDDGLGHCVKEHECPCQHNGHLYAAGAEIPDNCNTCTCKLGKWECTDNNCPGTCTIYGSGHYNTFDKQRFGFNGDCGYVAVQNKCGNRSGTFHVITENVPCGTTGTTCSKTVRIQLGRTQLDLIDGTITDRELLSGPKNYKVTNNSLYVVIESDVGLTVLWDRKTTVRIILQPQHMGEVCGLCGNYNGNGKDDFTTQGQLQVSDIMEFVNSWKVYSSCPDAELDFDPCSERPNRHTWAKMQCSIIRGDTFKDCRRMVDPDPYFENCVRDSCACDTGGDCECFCTAVAAYAQACNEAGVCVAWRTPEICPVFCDFYNRPDECTWHYSPCHTPCYKTCLNPQGQCRDPLPNLEGCYPVCPDDKPFFDEQNSTCVDTCDPMCIINGTVYKPWEEIPSNKPCHSCYCNENRNETCLPRPGCCFYNGKEYGENETIYDVTDNMGMCYSAICINSTVVNMSEPCNTPSTPQTETTSYIITTKTIPVSTTKSVLTPTTFGGTSNTPSSSTPTTTETEITTLITKQTSKITQTPFESSESPTTATTPTTPATPTETTECVICEWSEWFNVDYPSTGSDIETYENIKKKGHTICENPEDIQCRAVSNPDMSLDEFTKITGQVVECSVSFGLVCEKDKQTMRPYKCVDYKIRVLCCNPCVTATPNATVTMVTSTTPVITSGPTTPGTATNTNTVRTGPTKTTRPVSVPQGLNTTTVTTGTPHVSTSLAGSSSTKATTTPLNTTQHTTSKTTEASTTGKTTEATTIPFKSTSQQTSEGTTVVTIKPSTTSPISTPNISTTPVTKTTIVLPTTTQITTLPTSSSTPSSAPSTITASTGSHASPTPTKIGTTSTRTEQTSSTGKTTKVITTPVVTSSPTTEQTSEQSTVVTTKPSTTSPVSTPVVSTSPVTKTTMILPTTTQVTIVPTSSSTPSSTTTKIGTTPTETEQTSTTGKTTKATATPVVTSGPTTEQTSEKSTAVTTKPSTTSPVSTPIVSTSPVTKTTIILPTTTQVTTVPTSSSTPSSTTTKIGTTPTETEQTSTTGKTTKATATPVVTSGPTTEQTSEKSTAVTTKPSTTSPVSTPVVSTSPVTKTTIILPTTTQVTTVPTSSSTASSTTTKIGTTPTETEQTSTTGKTTKATATPVVTSGPTTEQTSEKSTVVTTKPSTTSPVSTPVVSTSPVTKTTIVLPTTTQVSTVPTSSSTPSSTTTKMGSTPTETEQTSTTGKTTKATATPLVTSGPTTEQTSEQSTVVTTKLFTTSPISVPIISSSPVTKTTIILPTTEVTTLITKQTSKMTQTPFEPSESPTTATTPTTPATPTETTECVICEWSEWFNVDYPLTGSDIETYENIKKKGHTICENPEDIQCRAVSNPDMSLDEFTKLTGQVVECSVSFGLVCDKDKQTMRPYKCVDYKIRVLCCNPCVTATPNATVTMVTSTKTSTLSSISPTSFTSTSNTASTRPPHVSSTTTEGRPTKTTMQITTAKSTKSTTPVITSGPTTPGTATNTTTVRTSPTKTIPPISTPQDLSTTTVTTGTPHVSTSLAGSSSTKATTTPLNTPRHTTSKTTEASTTGKTTEATTIPFKSTSQQTSEETTVVTIKPSTTSPVSTPIASTSFSTKVTTGLSTTEETTNIEQTSTTQPTTTVVESTTSEKSIINTTLSTGSSAPSTITASTGPHVSSTTTKTGTTSTRTEQTFSTGKTTKATATPVVTSGPTTEQTSEKSTVVTTKPSTTSPVSTPVVSTSPVTKTTIILPTTTQVTTVPTSSSTPSSTTTKVGTTPTETEQTSTTGKTTKATATPVITSGPTTEQTSEKTTVVTTKPSTTSPVSTPVVSTSPVTKTTIILPTTTQVTTVPTSSSTPSSTTTKVSTTPTETEQTSTTGKTTKATATPVITSGPTTEQTSEKTTVVTTKPSTTSPVSPPVVSTSPVTKTTIILPTTTQVTTVPTSSSTPSSTTTKVGTTPTETEQTSTTGKTTKATATPVITSGPTTEQTSEKTTVVTTKPSTTSPVSPPVVSTSPVTKTTIILPTTTQVTTVPTSSSTPSSTTTKVGTTPTETEQTSTTGKTTKATATPVITSGPTTEQTSEKTTVVTTKPSTTSPVSTPVVSTSPVTKTTIIPPTTTQVTTVPTSSSTPSSTTTKISTTPTETEQTSTTGKTTKATATPVVTSGPTTEQTSEKSTVVTTKPSTTSPVSTPVVSTSPVTKTTIILPTTTQVTTVPTSSSTPLSTTTKIGTTPTETEQTSTTGKITKATATPEVTSGPTTEQTSEQSTVVTTKPSTTSPGSTPIISTTPVTKTTIVLPTTTPITTLPTPSSTPSTITTVPHESSTTATISSTSTAPTHPPNISTTTFKTTEQSLTSGQTMKPSTSPVVTSGPTTKTHITVITGGTTTSPLTSSSQVLITTTITGTPRVSTSSTGRPSTTPCFCIINGKHYQPGEIILNKTDIGSGICLTMNCSASCEIQNKTELCGHPSPSPTPHYDCPPWEVNTNETFEVCNCTMARCIEDNIIEILPFECPPVQNITCVNNKKPVSLPDECLCIEQACDCVCEGWGDPHYITFDGLFYSHQGNCTYVLMQEIRPKHNLKVYIDNVKCDPREPVSCPRALIVHYNHIVITLKNNNLVGAANLQASIGHTVLRLPFAKNGMRVVSSDVNLILEIPQLQVVVTFGVTGFSLFLPFRYFGNNTQGHCGTCNNNQADDCRLPDGKLLDNCEIMADYWPAKDLYNPDCPVPPLVPTPPPTKPPCPPNPVCELLKSNLFKECHPFISPDNYFKGCQFDSCHMTNPAAVCTSLQTYAFACSQFGICLHWRNHTDLCAVQCPGDKVYKPCGPAEQPSCQDRPNDYTLNVTTEGCFCPDGTLLFNKESGLCVEKCGCLDPSGQAREPGEQFQHGCQDCVCDEATISVNCKAKQCSNNNQVTCSEPGFVPVNETDPSDVCCTIVSCHCDSRTCPSIEEKCKIGYTPVLKVPDGKCCPELTCEPKKVCAHKNMEYEPGTTVPVVDCQECKCTWDVDPKTQLYKIKCEFVTCNTECKPGYEYVESDNDCCGKCVQSKCIVNHNGTTHLLQTGTEWAPINTGCNWFTCTFTGGEYITTSYKTQCPPLNIDNCEPGTVQLSSDGCCQVCVEKEKGCKVQSTSDYITDNNCMSDSVVEQTHCEGDCNSYSKYSELGSSSCSCCKATRTTNRTVTLNCMNGDTVPHTYVHVEECSCEHSKCIASKS
ncbi:uncharacterized protein muc2.1 isoform X2 [Brachyhypopomus gauderio]|uniref:uncharacterized protein muc2.1 isoform X2 n=1 Tax=Brachyhypopomus gauderio TaxID=698409 RepID=UPI0040426471